MSHVLALQGQGPFYLPRVLPSHGLGRAVFFLLTALHQLHQLPNRIASRAWVILLHQPIDRSARYARPCSHLGNRNGS